MDERGKGKMPREREERNGREKGTREREKDVVNLSVYGI
jgi:hypothetical protein